MTTPLSLGLRVLALAAIVFASFGLIGAAYDALFPLGDLGLNLSLISTTETVLAWLTISILFAMVLAYPIVRSRWAGGRLALSVFLAFYGITTVLSVIEVSHSRFVTLCRRTIPVPWSLRGLQSPRPARFGASRPSSEWDCCSSPEWDTGVLR